MIKRILLGQSFCASGHNLILFENYLPLIFDDFSLFLCTYLHYRRYQSMAFFSQWYWYFSFFPVLQQSVIQFCQSDFLLLGQFQKSRHFSLSSQQLFSFHLCRQDEKLLFHLHFLHYSPENQSSGWKMTLKLIKGALNLKLWFEKELLLWAWASSSVLSLDSLGCNITRTSIKILSGQMDEVLKCKKVLGVQKWTRNYNSA